MALQPPLAQERSAASKTRTAPSAIGPAFVFVSVIDFTIDSGSTDRIQKVDNLSKKAVRHSTAVTRPLCKGKDVGSNPADDRNENWTLGKAPCTEGAPVVQQDLSGRPAM